ncbi:hypothetical protein ACFL0Y_03865, partial [Patescibacteria group bacterium]
NNSYLENLNLQKELKVEEKFLLGGKGNMGWIEPVLKGTAPPYLLEYYFDLPYPVLRADIKTDARLFNSGDSQAKIRGFFVDQEEAFEDYSLKNQEDEDYLFFKVESDGSNTYAPGGSVNVFSRDDWGGYRRSGYSVLKPKSNKFLISYLFTSQYYRADYFLAQIYNIGQGAFFKFALDTTDLKIFKINELTEVEIEKDDQSERPVVIDLIYR